MVCIVNGLLALVAVGSCAGPALGVAADAPWRIYSGMADASAAVFVDERRVVVADDEGSALRIYDAIAGGAPLATVELSAFLGTDPDDEPDIEGAAHSGDRIYWITSHGRNKHGCSGRARAALFATTIERHGDNVSLRPVGRPYRGLIGVLLGEPGPAHEALRRAIGVGASGDLVRCDEELAPKRGGLNIEALAAGPDGVLYIGLRNPTHEIGGRPHAIVLRVLNPVDVVEGRAAPRLAEPLFWDLGGAVPRSLDYCPTRQAYLLVAGPRETGDGWRLHRWSGNPAERPKPLPVVGPRSFEGVEALAEVPGTRRVLLLTDDGTLRVEVGNRDECEKGEYRKGGLCDNKHLTDARRKTFRGHEVAP